MGKPVLICVIVVAITMSACSSADRASSAAPTSAPVRVTPTTGHPRPTTTTSTPAFSFDDSVPPPKLVNTGTNYVAILKSLEAYGNWLAAHRPEPVLARRTVAGGTRLLRDYEHDITILRNNNKREVETRTGPNAITILSTTPTAFSARVVERITAHQIVDATGHVSNQRLFTGPTTYIDVVVLADGHWYLADVKAQT